MMNMAYPRKWLHTSPISQTSGAKLFRSIEQEVDRVNLLSSTLYNNKQILLEQQQLQQQQNTTNNGDQQLNNNNNNSKGSANKNSDSALELEASEYRTQLANIHGILGDAMMSAVHREIYHYHVNHAASLPPTSFSASSSSSSSSCCSSSNSCNDDDDDDHVDAAENKNKNEKNKKNSSAITTTTMMALPLLEKQKHQHSKKWRSKKHRHHNYPQSTASLLYNLRIATDEDESYVVNDIDAGETDEDEEEEDEENNTGENTNKVSQHKNGVCHHNNNSNNNENMNDEVGSQTSSSSSPRDANSNSKNRKNTAANNNNNNNSNPTSATAANSANANNSNTVGDQKSKRRDEAKKKRQEDDDLLKIKRVKTEKSNLLTTIGPFPVPRMTVRSLKAGTPVPSRKNLTQRLNLEHLESSSSSTDEEEREILNRLAATPYLQQKYNNRQNNTSTSKNNNYKNNGNDDDDDTSAAAENSASASSSSSSSAPIDEQDIVNRLVKFLSPLSLDSLKKIGESAKMKLKGGISQEDAVQEIARTSMKIGSERVCILMDKTKLLEKIAIIQNTSKTHILSQFTTNVPSYLGTLKPEALKILAPALGIPPDTITLVELWERFVALGLGGVFCQLRPRPLKKIGQEVSVAINENLSTEKQCDQLVYALFPRERLRVRYAKKIRRVPGVSFAVTPNKTRCLEDMGYIGFTIHNVSQMRNDQGERHYSPEFEFGNLRWSLLCMCNKEALALYLCQQGSVHCKFVISVVNHINPEDAVYNEGTQEFKQSSSENDWGFNNVIKFDQLLEPKIGFWKADGDIIQVELGIVLVSESGSNNNGVAATPTNAAITATPKDSATSGSNISDNKKQNNNNPSSDTNNKEDITDNNNNNNNNNNNKQNGKKDAKGNNTNNTSTNNNNNNSKNKDPQAEIAEHAQQLLEAERIEALRRRIKQQFTKLHSEEERLRKEAIAKNNQDFQRMIDQSKKDELRITKDAAEREKKEQLERQREQEKLRLLQEQHQELRKKVSDLTDENSDIAAKKKQLAAETAELKSGVVDARKKDLAVADASLEQSRSRLDDLQRRLEERRNRLAALRARIDALPSEQETASQELVEDNEILKSVQQSLAGIIDF